MKELTLIDYYTEEPRLQQLMVLLRGLPRFDKELPASKLQGDIPEVQAAEKLYHTFNGRYQKRVIKTTPEGTAVTKEGGLPVWKIIRERPLQLLYVHPDWKNFQKLLSHSTIGRARKKASNERYRSTHTGKNFRWLLQTRKKRQDRANEWFSKNEAKMLEQVADHLESFRSQWCDSKTGEISKERWGKHLKKLDKDYEKADEFPHHIPLLQVEVLNDLEGWFGEVAAWRRYWEMVFQVCLGLYSSTTGKDKLATALLNTIEKDGLVDANVKQEMSKSYPRIKTQVEKAVDSVVAPEPVFSIDEDEDLIDEDEEPSVWEEMGLVS